MSSLQTVRCAVPAVSSHALSLLRGALAPGLVILVAGCATVPAPAPAPSPDTGRHRDAEAVAIREAARTNPSALRLASSTSTLPPEASLVLVVGPEALVLEPDALLELAAGELPLEALDKGGYVPALRTELVRWMDARQRMAREHGLPVDARLALVADASLSGRSLRAIAATAHVAGIDTLELVVGDGHHALPLRLVEAPDSTDALAVTLEGTGASARFGLEPATALPDATALYNHALALAARQDAQGSVALTRVRFVLTAEATLQQLVTAADAVRHGRVATAGEWIPVPVEALEDSAPAVSPGGTPVELLPTAELDLSP